MRDEGEVLFVEHGDADVTDKAHCGECSMDATDKAHCGECFMDVTDKAHCGECELP
jgi:hypothetical protein